MTDKITKELAKLSAKERVVVAQILSQLKSGELTGLQVVQLKGYSDIFRVRRGRLRIIYQTKGDRLAILAIERRSEKTYRSY